MSGSVWLTFNGVLEQVPLSRNTIYKALICGELAGKLIGNKWIVSQDAVDRWLAPETGNPAERVSGEASEFIHEIGNGLTAVSYE